MFMFRIPEETRCGSYGGTRLVDEARGAGLAVVGDGPDGPEVPAAEVVGVDQDGPSAPEVHEPEGEGGRQFEVGWGNWKPTPGTPTPNPNTEPNVATEVERTNPRGEGG